MSGLGLFGALGAVAAGAMAIGQLVKDDQREQEQSQTVTEDNWDQAIRPGQGNRGNGG